jgi:hypothetical protein
MARHEFQEAFKNYRDLRFLAQNLQGWADKLGAFGDMLANRRQAYADRLPQVRSKAGALGLDRLQQARDDVATELARVEAASDGTALADARQQAQLARLDAVAAAVKRLEPGPKATLAHERARLVAGALTWQLAQEYPARLWDARKALRIIDSGLADARRREAALAEAQREEPARHERFAARIGGLEQRIRALIPRVVALQREQQGQVQEMAIAELTGQKERLAAYTTQARFAVAQLFDRAALARDGNHAPKP